MRIAAFDLDGTLIRGQTVGEAIAEGIGRIDRMREFEQLGSNQIEEMAEWYSSFSFDDLCQHLTAIRVAPGVDEGLDLLRDHGFRIAIVSLTWEFAVEWFAKRFGADYSVGTGLKSDGLVTHFWPQDKAKWLTGLAAKLDVDMKDVAAVGDSKGDIPMLLSVGHRYWVGETIPSELEKKVIHKPAGDILLLAHRINEDSTLASVWQQDDNKSH